MVCQGWLSLKGTVQKMYLYKDILINNPYITKVLDYLPIMDNQIIMEGTAQWKGLFDISIMATVLTQRVINYLNNGETRIMFDLRED